MRPKPHPLSAETLHSIAEQGRAALSLEEIEPQPHPRWRGCLKARVMAEAIAAHRRTNLGVKFTARDLARLAKLAGAYVDQLIMGREI